MVETDASEIRLRVPARAPYARVVRVGAAALALRLEMGFGEIDDVRLAIDEAMIMLLDDLGPEDDDTDIEIVFRLTDGGFAFEATRLSTPAISERAARRFGDMASEIVDRYEIDPSAGRLAFHKTASPHSGEEQSTDPGERTPQIG